MQKFDYLDKKRHGTSSFPVEYYYVDEKHPRYQMAFHWHNEWELLRIRSGSFKLTLDGDGYEIKEGDVVLISAETLHGGEPKDAVYDCLVFDLYGLFSKTESVKPHLRPFYKMDYATDRFFTSADAPVVKLLDIFENEDTSACLELDVISAIMELFGWIIKEGRYQKIPTKSKWSSSIKPCLEYIEAHYSEQISLDALADVAGMNARYFCKVFYSLTHTTPMSYVNFYRIEQATLLLELTEYSVTDIAQKCGFWESSYFTKVFKKFKNTTPKQYRAQVKAKNAYSS